MSKLLTMTVEEEARCREWASGFREAPDEMGNVWAARLLAEVDALRAALAAAEAKLAELEAAIDPGACPCCGHTGHAGHSLDCTFADDCPEEARSWDRVHEAIASNAARRAAEVNND